MNFTPTSNLPPAGAAASGESAVVGAMPGAVFDTLAAAAPLAAPFPLADAAAPFAQWLAQALPELLAEAAPPEAHASEAEPATEASADDTADGAADAAPDAAPAQPVAQDVTMLAAMAAPLVAPAALTARAPAAAAAPASAGAAEQDAGDDPFLAAISRGAGASRGAAAGPAPRMEMRAAAAQDTQGAADGAARVAMPSTSNETAAPAAAAAATAASAPVRPASGMAGAQGGAATADAAGQDKLASVAAPAWGATAPAPAAASPAGATVALEGPPAAWRQTLQSALGERLQTQVGNNMEQAVIRLEPPNLGRIEIAIRYSAGALEVSLSATHTEVVRQLHAVTENLRNDLASRQYSDVSVTVAQAAPRAQQGASNPFADQQGRGRQPSREQDDATPGTALQDAGNPNTSFSLNGRD